jgi:hypothetical protein
MDLLLGNAKMDSPDPNINVVIPNLTIGSLDGKNILSIKDQRKLADEYWTLLASAHECLV